MTTASSPLIRMMEFTNLPTLPHILLQVLEICNRDDASLSAIAELISKDAALSSRVMGASNTPRFVKHSKFISLEHSLSLLGLDIVKTMAISSSFYQVFNTLGTGPGFDFKTFWGRSLTQAVLSRLLAQETGYAHREEAYLTGLLLDIGQLVLWSNFPRQYAQLLSESANDAHLMTLESEKLGNTHCEVGSWLVSNWNLNSFIADAVLFHHLPQEKVAGAHPLIVIAQVANRLTMLHADDTATLGEIETLLEFPAARLRQLLDDSGKIVDDVAQSLGIEIDTSLFRQHSQLNSAAPDNMRLQKSRLATELRDNVMVGRNPFGAGPPTSLDDTLATVQRSVNILFGIQEMAFFFPDPSHQRLQGKCLSEQSLLINEISVSLRHGDGLIGKAFSGRKAVASFDEPDTVAASIPDRQVIRLLGREGIYCQPIFTRTTGVGVLVFGIHPSQLTQIRKQDKLVSMFAQQAAQAIALVNTLAEQESRIKAEMTAQARDQARHLVHEANNPLGIIKNYIHLLEGKLSAEDSARSELKIIQDEIDRVSRIIKTVATADTAALPANQVINVNEVIRSVYTLTFEPLFARNRIHAEIRLDPNVPNVAVNRDKLIQILMNLLKNAAEALQHGGSVRIATHANVRHEGRNHIEIQLKDDGPGMTQYVRDNLFTPLASTKGTEHAGLGLSIVKRIIDEMGGWISCQSDEASGTAFQILLPVDGGPADTAQPGSSRQG